MQNHLRFVVFCGDGSESYSCQADGGGNTTLTSLSSIKHQREAARKQSRPHTSSHHGKNNGLISHPMDACVEKWEFWDTLKASSVPLTITGFVSGWQSPGMFAVYCRRPSKPSLPRAVYWAESLTSAPHTHLTIQKNIHWKSVGNVRTLRHRQEEGVLLVCRMWHHSTQPTCICLHIKKRNKEQWPHPPFLHRCQFLSQRVA